MDTSRLAVAAALVGLLTVSPSVAQQPLAGDSNPAQQSVQGASVNYDDTAAPSPASTEQPQRSPSKSATRRRSDVLRPGTITASYAKQKTANLGCCEEEKPEEKESGCAAPEEEEEKEECRQCCSGPLGCWGHGCCLYELGEPFKLANLTPRLQKRDITIAGWIAQSYTWNPYNPSDNRNGPVTWLDQANRYQLNELYLYAVKPTDTKGEGWDFGFRADAFYGTSYRWDTEAGLESTFNTGHTYGLALTQFYGEVAYNDLKVKVGHFISPVGFYTVGTYNNFFNTIPYTYQYGEPFTHTGVLANYQVTEKVNLGAGLIHGWDAFDSSFNKWGGYLGTATINGNADDSLAFVQVYSHEPTENAARPFTQRYFQTLVYTRPLKKISDKLSYIIQSDFGVQGQATLTGKTARWYGVNQYLYYKKNDLVSWGINFEWFRDEEGFRVTAPVPSAGSPFAQGWALAPGFAGNFYQTTMGPRWTPLPNLTIRPNFRCDWYHGTVNSQGLKPYDGGTRNNQQALYTDVIISF
ncbi:MAG TPA: outer membrane beta-barrel protein [Pirellulales bacterium]|nr:outer membrane beta-barrel protein [Pirellulales bacterium]